MSSKIRIKELCLTNYRNHNKLKLRIQKEIILLYGENGSGKTNILEAISMLSCPAGFRSSKLPNLFPNDLEKNYLNFSINFNLLSDKEQLMIGIGISEKNNTQTKLIKVDGAKVNNYAFYKKYNIFWLLPSMNNLFNSNASERRSFLDLMITSGEKSHQENINIYKKLQSERLKILKNFNNSKSNDMWLASIEKKMASIGVVLCDARRQFIKKINNYSLESPSKLPILKIALTGEIDKELENRPALFVEEKFLEKLKNNRRVDTLIGRTQYSANKTDITVYNKNKKQYSTECSTGEQKVMLITIVFQFIQILKEKSCLRLIFLLDDIFAFLDKTYINIILEELISLRIQTWITNVDNNCIDESSKSYKDVTFLDIKDIKM
jgi:DNA replication and repair protein RecF